MGKQAIDDDCDQTGQMLAADRLAAGNFACPVDGGDVSVTREVDGGFADRQTRPRVVTPFATPRAALRQPAEHHEGEEKRRGSVRTALISSHASRSSKRWTGAAG